MVEEDDAGMSTNHLPQKPCSERGVSTLAALLAVFVALVVGSTYGIPDRVIDLLPSQVSDGIGSPTVAPTTSVAEGASEAPTLRAGRHSSSDRLVIDGAEGCTISSEPDIEYDGTEWLVIRCDTSLEDLEFRTPRPVDAGLANTIGWYVRPNRDALVVHVAEGTVDWVDEDGTTDTIFVVDLYDPDI